MKFKQDKEYSFISNSEPFEASWKSNSPFYDIQCTKPKIFKESLQWQLDNYRNHSAYDSPKCESSRTGAYVKANYVLTLEYQIDIQGKMSFIPWTDQTWAFETKKEMMEFLNTYMDYMVKGEKGEYGYYNSSEFKINKRGK